MKNHLEGSINTKKSTHSSLHLSVILLIRRSDVLSLWLLNCILFPVCSLIFSVEWLVILHIYSSPHWLNICKIQRPFGKSEFVISHYWWLKLKKQKVLLQVKEKIAENKKKILLFVLSLGFPFDCISNLFSSLLPAQPSSLGESIQEWLQDV